MLVLYQLGITHCTACYSIELWYWYKVGVKHTDVDSCFEQWTNWLNIFVWHWSSWILLDKIETNKFIVENKCQMLLSLASYASKHVWRLLMDVVSHAKLRRTSLCTLISLMRQIPNIKIIFLNVILSSFLDTCILDLLDP